MKFAVRFHTRSGNSQKLAAAIAAATGTNAENVSVPLEEKTDILFLCNSMYGADVDDEVKAFLKSNAVNIGKIFNVSTAAIAASTYKLVKPLAEQNGITMAEEEFHCRGRFLVMHRGRPNDEDLKNATEFAKNIISKYGDD